MICTVDCAISWTASSNIPKLSSAGALLSCSVIGDVTSSPSEFPKLSSLAGVFVSLLSVSTVTSNDPKPKSSSFPSVSADFASSESLVTNGKPPKGGNGLSSTSPNASNADIPKLDADTLCFMLCSGAKSLSVFSSSRDGAAAVDAEPKLPKSSTSSSAFPLCSTIISSPSYAPSTPSICPSWIGASSWFPNETNASETDSVCSALAGTISEFSFVINAGLLLLNLSTSCAVESDTAIAGAKLSQKLPKSAASLFSSALSLDSVLISESLLVPCGELSSNAPKSSSSFSIKFGDELISLATSWFVCIGLSPLPLKLPKSSSFGMVLVPVSSSTATIPLESLFSTTSSDCDNLTFSTVVSALPFPCNEGNGRSSTSGNVPNASLTDIVCTPCE